MGTPLTGKNLLPKEADSFLEEQFLMTWKITFTMRGSRNFRQGGGGGGGPGQSDNKSSDNVFFFFFFFFFF